MKQRRRKNVLQILFEQIETIQRSVFVFSKISRRSFFECRRVREESFQRKWNQNATKLLQLKSGIARLWRLWTGPWKSYVGKSDQVGSHGKYPCLNHLKWIPKLSQIKNLECCPTHSHRRLPARSHLFMLRIRAFERYSTNETERSTHFGCKLGLSGCSMTCGITKADW